MKTLTEKRLEKRALIQAMVAATLIKNKCYSALEIVAENAACNTVDNYRSFMEMASTAFKSKEKFK